MNDQPLGATAALGIWVCRQHNHIRTLIIPEHHRPAVEDNRCGRHTQSQAPYSRSIPFLHHTRSTPAAPGDIPEAHPQASFVHYPSKCSNETSDKDSWMERRRGGPGYIPGSLLMAARLFRDLSPFLFLNPISTLRTINDRPPTLRRQVSTVIMGGGQSCRDAPV